MALNTRISVEAQNAQLDTLTALLNSGYIQIYSGAQPATPNTAITTQVLLADPRFGSPAFAAAAGGVATANPITSDWVSNATGVAAWCRLLKSDGVTPIMDGSVGLSGANVNLDNLNIQFGGQVGVTSLTIALPMQGL